MHENEKTKTFVNMEECIKALNLAVAAFQQFLGDKASSDSISYYQAHKHLEEGKAFYREALSEVNKLIGSLPSDASPGFLKWKETFLKGTGILSESKEFETLKSELHNDAFLQRFLTPGEIDALLMKHYESQQTGKRKLANIKARIILDKMLNLMDEADTLDIKAKEKLYQLR